MRIRITTAGIATAARTFVDRAFRRRRPGFSPAGRRGNIQLVGLMAAAALGLIMQNDDVQASLGVGAKAARASQQSTASSLMSTMNALANAYSTMQSSNSVPNSQITWDAAPLTGLFNPTDGGGIGQTQVPPDALTAAATAGTRGWVYRSNLVPRNVGTGLPTFAVTVVGIKDTVCRQLNFAQKIATTETAAPPASGLAAAAWNATATSIDLSGVSAIAGRRIACLSTTDGEFAVFRTLQDG